MLGCRNNGKISLLRHASFTTCLPAHRGCYTTPKCHFDPAYRQAGGGTAPFAGKNPILDSFETSLYVRD
ncbi:MAG TPA: hypothetical protein VMV36_07455 [Ignavibacteriaceae bacterium]|nr:hypothetical protein [Ignavibacteriaceae bacterium]